MDQDAYEHTGYEPLKLLKVGGGGGRGGIPLCVSRSKMLALGCAHKCTGYRPLKLLKVCLYANVRAIGGGAVGLVSAFAQCVQDAQCGGGPAVFCGGPRIPQAQDPACMLSIRACWDALGRNAGTPRNKHPTHAEGSTPAAASASRPCWCPCRYSCRLPFRHPCVDPPRG